MASSLGDAALGITRDQTDLYGHARFDWHNYADVRPRYPDELFKALFDYHRAHGGQYDLACDFGTGTGTVLPALLTTFKQAYASDLNEQQLGILRKTFVSEITSKRVIVEQNEAGKESSLLQDDSADLFVAATAAHWFDRPAWYSQAAKKLKRGGTLCYFNYQTKPFIYTCPEADVAFTKLNDYFFASAYKVGSKGGVFASSGVGDSSMFKSFEDPPKALFAHTERHFWHFDPSVRWTYPHKRWLETVMGICPTDGTHDAFASDTKIVHHPSTVVGAPTSIAYTDWTLDHLIAYMVSMGSFPAFDPNDAEFKSIRQELESALGGPGQTFGVSWQVSMLLSTKQ